MADLPVPLWIAEGPTRTFPALVGDHQVDVAVIGAGITGITTALLCKRAGLKVGLVEAQKVAGGESGHTTAHLTELIDHRYHVIAGKHGKEKARRVAESQRAAIERIATFVDQLGLDCGFRRVPGYLFTESTRDLAVDVMRELRATQAVGIDSAYVSTVPLPFTTRGALRLESQAQLDPRRYLLGLVDLVPGDGSYVWEDTRALALERGEPARVRTNRGILTARHVVYATDQLPNALLLATRAAAYRTYVLAAKVRSPPPAGLYWDTEDPYHYLRTQEMPGGTYLIVGGEDHKTGRDVDNADAFRKLEEYVRSRFEVESIPYRWSGQIMEPVDGLPFIGRHTSAKNAYVATGYSGTGMTFGTVAGMLISDLILGVQNPWERVYDPRRIKPLAAAKEFLRENVDFPLHLVADRLGSADLQSPGELGPGEGGLLQVHQRKVAVYRDEQGQLHALSPVCSHMGCHVSWNNAEKSWDCPCHGGRYDARGQVIHGPPVRDLKPLELSELQQGEEDERAGTSETAAP